MMRPPQEGGQAEKAFWSLFFPRLTQENGSFSFLFGSPTGAGSLGASAKVRVALFVKIGFIMMLTQKKKLNIKRLMKGFSHDYSATINQRPEKWLVYNENTPTHCYLSPLHIAAVGYN